jgi:hypothetical protein
MMIDSGDVHQLKATGEPKQRLSLRPITDATGSRSSTPRLMATTFPAASEPIRSGTAAGHHPTVRCSASNWPG